jgi:hypothetical protein
MLGKLHTSLSDESFRAGLLCSWRNASPLPKLGEMAQCLRDTEVTPTVQKNRKHPADEDCNGALPQKRVWLR